MKQTLIRFDLLATVQASSLEAPESARTQEEDTPGEKYYDKSKGFFDNISADTKPR